MSKKKQPRDELLRLLSLRASTEEVANLEKMEINLKKPTRMTVIAAAIYKKAASGELSAIKELLSIIGTADVLSGGVTLVDDIGKT